jgi:hypothetical protein
MACSWRDVLYGLENELLDPEAPIDVAIHELAKHDDAQGDLMELAGSGRSDSTLPLVNRLAALEAAPATNDVLDRWSYLALAWIYRVRSIFSDPLQLVEDVYADFEYPERIAPFVRSMPAEGDAQAVNDERLLERWKQYLEECEARFAAA